VQVAADSVQMKETKQEDKVATGVFKALNDKWVAGSDYKSKTLFEDILFLDRASRNIGDTVIVDIFDLQNTILNKEGI